jgi:hypothetical protein
MVIAYKTHEMGFYSAGGVRWCEFRCTISIPHLLTEYILIPYPSISLRKHKKTTKELPVWVGKT